MQYTILYLSLADIALIANGRSRYCCDDNVATTAGDVCPTKAPANRRPANAAATQTVIAPLEMLLLTGEADPRPDTTVLILVLFREQGHGLFMSCERLFVLADGLISSPLLSSSR